MTHDALNFGSQSENSAYFSIFVLPANKNIIMPQCERLGLSF